MLNSFWESIQNQQFTRWAANTLAPSFIFWIAGFITLVLRDGWKVWELWFTQLSNITQNALLLCFIITIVMSIGLVRILEPFTLLFLQGYWPVWLRSMLGFRIKKYWKNIEDAERKWQDLLSQREKDQREGTNILSPIEHEQLATLEQSLRKVPLRQDYWMPTKLGNTLRAAERKPLDKYGLGTGVCWPRLWLLLPKNICSELSAVRATFDGSIRVWIWAVLLVIWGWFIWWMFLLGILVAIVVYYFWILRAAETYGDLIESTFDIYRIRLFQALRWPLPTNPAEEFESGEQLTEYLARGLEKTIPSFTNLELRDETS